MNKKKPEKEKQRTILIFGVNSFVGANIAEYLKNDFRIVGTYHKEKCSADGILTIPCDVLVKDEVQLVIYAFKPDICIYAVGVNSVYGCSEYTKNAEALNTSGLFNVAEFCQRYRAQICYLSTHFVFSGDQKKYIEMDIPDPNTVLGRTKSSAEFYLQKTSLNYIIFRCCHLYGRNPSAQQDTWFEKTQLNLQDGNSIKADTAVKSGFLDIDYLSMLMKVCFEKKVVNRLFQISSQDALTYFDFAKLYCKQFGENENLVNPDIWPFKTEVGQKISEQQNYLLDSSNIEGFLNITVPTIEESIEYTFNKYRGEKDTTSKTKKTKKGGVSYI